MYIKMTKDINNATIYGYKYYKLIKKLGKHDRFAK